MEIIVNSPCVSPCNLGLVTSVTSVVTFYAMYVSTALDIYYYHYLERLTHEKRVNTSIADPPHSRIVDQLHDPLPLHWVVCNLGILHTLVTHIPGWVIHHIVNSVKFAPGAEAPNLDFDKAIETIWKPTASTHRPLPVSLNTGKIIPLDNYILLLQLYSTLCSGS